MNRIGRFRHRLDEALDPYRGLEAERRAELERRARPLPAPAPVVVARGIDALQNTDGRPSDDFPGAVE